MRRSQGIVGYLATAAQPGGSVRIGEVLCQGGPRVGRVWRLTPQRVGCAGLLVLCALGLFALVIVIMLYRLAWARPSSCHVNALLYLKGAVFLGTILDQA